MQIHRGFQCKSCNTFLSHPIDACPVCGDQFYWLVHTSESLDASRRAAYVGTMVNLMEGAVTEEFLTHGDQLWLPYQFWKKSPSGDTLNEFPWIADLELYQHDGNGGAPEAETEAVAPSEPNPWDTVPKMALPDFSKKKPEPEPPAKQARASAEPVISPAEPEVVTVRAPKQRRNRQKPKEATSSAKRPKAEFFFAPLMIFLFFLLLSLAYLALRYHKNQMVPRIGAQATVEVHHERPLLS